VASAAAASEVRTELMEQALRVKSVSEDFFIMFLTDLTDFICARNG
jgi:hypothetical protein